MLEEEGSGRFAIPLAIVTAGVSLLFLVSFGHMLWALLTDRDLNESARKAIVSALSIPMLLFLVTAIQAIRYDRRQGSLVPLLGAAIFGIGFVSLLNAYAV